MASQVEGPISGGGEVIVPPPGTLLKANDAFVLESHRQENGNVVALLFLPNNMQHFATVILVHPKGDWVYGHYFDNVNEALHDFMERIH